MKKGKIYKGGCQTIYKQHNEDCNSLEYSLDNGVIWDYVPVDIGKLIITMLGLD